MKQNWQTKKLSEIFNDIKVEKAKEGSVPYVEIGDVNINTKTIVFKKKKSVKSAVVAPLNSIIVSRVRPTRGAISLLKNELVISSAFTVLKPKSFLSQKLLFYYLAYSEDFSKFLSKKQAGLLYPSIREKDILDYKICYPKSLSEQKRIISILDKAFADIVKTKDNAEKNLKNARELFESYLQNIFENKKWQIKKLEEFYKITSSKRVFKSEWERKGVPFYRAREIIKLAKQGFVDNDLYISEDMYNEYAIKYGIPKENDIMITGVGTLGICYVVKKDDKFYFKDGNVVWLKTKDDINSRFVEYAFKSTFVKKQVDDGLGATVGTFTIIKAKNTLIPTPSISEQSIVVKKLDILSKEVKKLEGIYQKKVVDLNELKKSILQRAFNGEL